MDADFTWHLDWLLNSLFPVGTGYLTACFALMVGPKGRAVGVEHIPELLAWSIKIVEQSAAAPLLKDGSLSLHVGGMVYSFVFPAGSVRIERYTTT